MATPAPKYIFQLVNTEGQEPLNIVFGESTNSNKSNFCDWDLDGNGDIRKIKLQQATVQSTLKCVFTEKQRNGYGTNIYSVIGEKDIIVRRTSLLMDLSMGLIAAKSFNDAQAVAQNLSPDDLMAYIGKFIVQESQTDVSKSIVSLTLVSNSGTQTTVGVL